MEPSEKNLYEQLVLISGVDPRQCMKCGKCSGACPAYDDMKYHPHQFVSKLLNGELSELMMSDSIWNCLSCMACIERCPRSVAPVKIIEAVRDAVIRKQGMNYLNTDSIPALLDDDIPQQAITCAFRRYCK